MFAAIRLCQTRTLISDTHSAPTLGWRCESGDRVGHRTRCPGSAARLRRCGFVRREPVARPPSERDGLLTLVTVESLAQLDGGLLAAAGGLEDYSEVAVRVALPPEPVGRLNDRDRLSREPF